MARAKTTKAPKSVGTKIGVARSSEKAGKDAVSAVEVADFTRDFAALIDEGTSLVRALEELQKRQSNATLKRVIGEVNAGVQAGQTLSAVLKEHPAVFDQAYVAAVRLGEVNGNLDMMLHGLAHGDDVLSFDDAVKFLGTSKPTLYRLLKQGDVKGLKVGRQWRFRKADLIAHMERKPTGIASAPRRDLEKEIAHLAGELQKLGVEPPALEGTKALLAEEAASEDEQKVHQLVKSFFLIALHSNAGDIHFDPQRDHVLVRLRIDGVLHELRRLPLSLMQPVIDRLKVMADLNVEEKRLPQDGRIHLHHQEKDRDYVVMTAICPSSYGESVVLRVLAQSQGLVELDQLDLEADHLAQLRNWLRRPHGLVLVTGSTGSGKTTLWYGCLHEINAPEMKLVTVEDPVECALPGAVQVHVDRKAGLTFSSVLRAFLRQDPDVIAISEIRDSETGELALQAASMGHTVIAGLPANSAVDAVLKLRDLGLEPLLLSNALLGVSAQRLARRLCGNCKEESVDFGLPPALRKTARAAGFVIPKNAKWSRGRGCAQCRQTGFRGRIALYELVTWNAALSDALARGASHEELTAINIESGSVSLLADGLRKAAQGKTSVEEVMRVLAIT